MRHARRRVTTSGRLARAASRLAVLASILIAGFTPVLRAASATQPQRVREWPGGTRAELTLPSELWAEILTKVDHADGPLGFTMQQMALFGRDACAMRTVTDLFSDVRMVPRFAGSRAEQFLAAATNPAALVELAYGLTDVSAGRDLPLPDSMSWGVTWIADGMTPAAALMGMLGYAPPEQAGHAGTLETGRIESRKWEQWNRLPESVQRLVVRVFIGATEARPWLRAAYDEPFFTRAVLGDDAVVPPAGGAIADEAWVREAYAFATAPWVDERLGQLATPRRASLEALQRLDREYLAFGSVVFMAHLNRALAEYRAHSIANPAAFFDFNGCEFDTYLGKVRILGVHNDEVDTPAFLTVDLGGDDVYKGRQAVPAGLATPISVLIDLSGNDTYDGGDLPAAIACGLFGIGALIDLDGNDVYRASESGLGAGWYGTGLLMDCAGNDQYTLGEHWGQGMGQAGVGLLVDLVGDDEYTCGYDAQGLGLTYGAGVLLDVRGDDRYTARDDGNISALYNNQSVSMAQGVGCGRRADLGDGHSLAGGVGLLVDGAGNDHYHATAWSQGAGYWWGLGMLEDLGGNDAYRNGKYSLGAAAHFAIGCQVDLSGNDRYNTANPQAVNQFQGHARDGSIGISIDGDGDDQYLFKSHCGGSGDLNSIGLFWDRRGADTYQVDYAPPPEPTGWNDTPPMGTTTTYTPFRSFRDDIDAVGIFLDTGGFDQYIWPMGPALNNGEWPTRREPRGWGIGVDREWYPPAGR